MMSTGGQKEGAGTDMPNPTPIHTENRDFPPLQIYFDKAKRSTSGEELEEGQRTW